MKMRMAAAFALGALVLAVGTGRPAHAGSVVLAPSLSALAAADDDPPPRGGREAVKKKAAEPEVPPEERPVYKTWWFWALTAAVVGGTIVLGVVTFKPSTNPPMACEVGVVACFGDGRAR